MTLNFTPITDSGSPHLSKSADNTYVIIANGVNDRGRWVADFQEPVNAGAKFTISGKVYTTAPLLRVSLVWIANLPGEQIHSVEQAVEIGPAGPDDPAPFEHIFAVPPGVKKLRVELRGRSGSGLYEFQDIEIKELADNPPDPPEEPQMQTISLIIGKTRWRITASEESITFLKLDHEPLLEGEQRHFWID